MLKLFKKKNCPACKGAGIKDQKWCTDCGGNGEILYLFSF
jgi:DnaJ-class molecular chaperone